MLPVRGIAMSAAAVLLAGCTSAVVTGHPTTGPRSPSAEASTTASSAPPTTGSEEPARFTRPSEANEVLTQARADLSAVNSYSYHELARSERNALAHATGSLRTSLRQTLERVVVPTARTRRIVQTAQVDAVGVRTTDPDSAHLIAAVGITTTQRGTTRTSAERVTLTVQRVGARWLLSEESVFSGQQPIPSFQTAGNSALVDAAGSATSFVQDVLTLRRAHFAADYGKAEALTTGTAHRSLVAEASRLRRALESKGEDTVGSVLAQAPTSVSASGRTATFVVFASSQLYRSPSQREAATSSTVVVTTVELGSRWLVSGVRDV